jgi:hypothetical protein
MPACHIGSLADQLLYLPVNFVDSTTNFGKFRSCDFYFGCPGHD